MSGIQGDVVRGNVLELMVEKWIRWGRANAIAFYKWHELILAKFSLYILNIVSRG